MTAGDEAVGREAETLVEGEGARIVARDLQEHAAQPHRRRALHHEGESLTRDALSPALLVAHDDAEVRGTGTAIDPRQVRESDEAPLVSQLDAEGEASARARDRA